MDSLSQQEIRDAFVNCSRSEAAELPMPPGLHEVDWSRREFLGWGDPRAAQRGFVVIPTGSGPAGIVLRASDASMRSTAPAMCGWCQDVLPTHDVYLYVAKRSGQAGRNGDTVGTMLCGAFGCCENVRRPASPSIVGFDADAVVADRIAGLAARARRFAATVVGTRI